MFDRLLLLVLSVSFLGAPANAAAQIVIESASSEQNDAQTDSDDEQRDDDQAEGTEAETNGSSSDEEATASTSSGVQIDAYGGDEDDAETDAQVEPEESTPQNMLAEQAVREAVRTAVRDRLSTCVGATPRPAEHGLRGGFVATESGDEAMVAKPSDLRYSDAMFLSDDESALPPRESKPLKTARKTEFDSCMSEIAIALGGASPVQTLTLTFEMVWFGENVLLRDVEWRTDDS